MNLRNYLEAGGFLHADDNYGMDEYFRREMKKVFPEKKLVELPPSHPIFHQKYNFENGIPKIHEHDGKPPKAFGILSKIAWFVCIPTKPIWAMAGKMKIVHNDPQDLREKALKMGANIISFIFNQ